MDKKQLLNQILEDTQNIEDCIAVLEDGEALAALGCKDQGVVEELHHTLKEAEKTVSESYRLAGMAPPPAIVVAESPLQAQRLANSTVSFPVSDPIWIAYEDLIYELREELYSLDSDLSTELDESTWARVAPTWADLRGRLAEGRKNVKATEAGMAWHEPCHHVGIADTVIAAYWRHLAEIGAIFRAEALKALDAIERAANCGIYEMIAFENKAIIVID